MPPRRRNAGRGTYGLLSDPYESLESRIKRLRGNDPEPNQDADSAAGPSSSTAAAAVRTPALLPPPRPVARTDVPNVRHLRRGSAAAAESALQQQGIQVLIEELVEDRHAKTSRGPIASYKRGPSSTALSSAATCPRSHFRWTSSWRWHPSSKEAATVASAITYLL
jgi:hypothetical protein